MKTYSLGELDAILQPRPEAPVIVRRPWTGPERPGDAYNRLHPIGSVLESLGFVPSHSDKDGAHYTRPGKDPREGHSATVYADAPEKAVIWSATCQQEWPALELQKPLDGFGLLAATAYDGDFTAASAALRREGYGDENGEQADRFFADLEEYLIGAAAHWPTDPKATVPDPKGPPITAEPPTVDGDKRFQVTLLADLYARPRGFTWLAKGLWPAGSHGQVAGPKKALKSYFAIAMAVGVAGGVSVLGTYEVPEALTVLYYVGEGGMDPWLRRFDRVARAYGIKNPESLPVYPVFDVGPALSPEFQNRLVQNLRDYSPGLVILDPLYAYHGAEVRASDLHQEGALLNALSAPCQRAGAALQVVNHFHKGGKGDDLDSITQAGSGEWVDSWVLLSHRQPPDVENGGFHLRAVIGSRQSGERNANIDFTLGPFDDELGDHVGLPSWKVYPSTGPFKDIPKGAKVADTKNNLLQALEDTGHPLTKTQLYEMVKGNRKVFDLAFEDLADTDHIDVVQVPTNRGKKMQITLGPNYYVSRGLPLPTPSSPSPTA